MSAHLDADGAVTFTDKRVAQALSRQISDSVTRHVRVMYGGDGSVLVAGIVEVAIMRAFGCTGRHHGERGSIYVEDVMCPLHGTDGVLTIPAGPQRDVAGEEAP
jgi:hypothetical protein